MLTNEDHGLMKMGTTKVVRDAMLRYRCVSCVACSEVWCKQTCHVVALHHVVMV